MYKCLTDKKNGNSYFSVISKVSTQMQACPTYVGVYLRKMYVYNMCICKMRELCYSKYCPHTHSQKENKSGAFSLY